MTSFIPASGTPYTMRLRVAGCDVTDLGRACSQISHVGRCAEGWQVYVYMSVRICELLYLYVHLVMCVSVSLCSRICACAYLNVCTWLFWWRVSVFTCVCLCVSSFVPVVCVCMCTVCLYMCCVHVSVHAHVRV